MKNKQRLISALAVAFSASAFSGGVVIEGTQMRQSSSGRLPLKSLTMPALQEAGRESKIAKGCFKLLSNPTIEITREAEVSRNGQTLDGAFNSYLSERAGKIIGCGMAVAIRAEENSMALTQSRPNRVQAIQHIEKNILKNLEADYENFKLANQDIFKIPVLIAKGNNGYSRDYMAFNDIVVEVEKAKQSVSGSLLKDQGGTMQAETTMLKTLIDGGENSAKEKATTVREIIFGGVYAFSTNPMQVNTLCSRILQITRKKAEAKNLKTKKVAQIEKYPCVEYYSVHFDGKEVEIRKSGQRWFDSEFIGGGVYAIELTGEKSTGTTIKVER